MKIFWIVLVATCLSIPCAAHADDRVAGRLSLPEPVPYLNTPENFFVGNGVAAGGGAGDGSWNFLAGPDYTCPNYLEREEIRLIVDGTEQALTMKVQRARKTGMFYGTETAGDLKIRLLDYALNGEPWVARLVTIENESPATAHAVSVRAYIHPLVGAGRTHRLAMDGNGNARGLELRLDTTLKCAMNRYCTNWADRCALIGFGDPASTAQLADKTVRAPASSAESNGVFAVLETAPHAIAPGGSGYATLYHYMYYADRGDGDGLKPPGPGRVNGGGRESAATGHGDGFEQVRRRNSLEDVQACIGWWQNWFDGVAPAYSLSRIKEERARNLVEGGLAILKMNECRDGGIVANERGWNMSYVRDAYCGLRGLGAFGHFEEAKRFIQWLDRQYAAHGLIPNAAPGGSVSYAHPNGNNGRTCPEANASVEVTALYLLAARDYYRATHDLQTLTRAGNSLRYAMDSQLKLAVQNGYRLEFSGDETELCGASDVIAIKAAGFNRNLAQYWSMTSIALCSASLEFYLQYLKLTGATAANYVNGQDHRTLNLNDELTRLESALERDFWRTNLPECPDGFHDWFRVKSDGAWPSGRIVNFTLFPAYYGTPLQYPDRLGRDVAAMKPFFDEASRSLPLVGLPGHKSLGHDLGYLLWGLVAVGDDKKAAVYDALVNGPTAGCWGTYHEAYQADGTPNANGLRTFETGVNLSAIGKYWGFGGE